MAQKFRSAVQKKSSFISTVPLISAFIAGVTGILAALLLTFYQFDQSPFYYSTEQELIHNRLGIFGAYVSAYFFYWFGVSAYCFIPFGFCLAWLFWHKKTLVHDLDRIVAALFVVSAVSVLSYIYRIGSIDYMIPGGLFGQNLFFILKAYLDGLIIQMFLWFMLFAACIVIAQVSFATVFTALVKALQYLFMYIKISIVPCLKWLKAGSGYFLLPLKFLYKQLTGLIYGTDITDSSVPVFAFEKAADAHQVDHVLFTQTDQTVLDQVTVGQLDDALFMPETKKVLNKTPLEVQKQAVIKNYSLPQPVLFDASVKQETQANSTVNKKLATTLEEKLLRFGISGSVLAIKPGPVITLFEYEPDIDAKVSKILGLEDDLALALQALSVRIIAPIPGTALVGFEVANKERSNVFLRDIIRADLFAKSKATLPIILGKDTSGSDVIVDLLDMPHLLVAGSTGSGKSVALNTLLISLLCTLKPSELKLIIIDPKRLEFASYQDIAHLLFPIITQPHKAGPVLRWLVKLMEQRYELMAQLGVRSIFDYKKMCKEKNQTDELPFIVVIIDELADLMMVARKEVEDAITRLAQMARAAGIHLIVATQRPSVDVITGIIKVNFPSRISFRVTSKVDSRTVLDALGAETLLGKGDMLFMDSKSARMRRVHGAYVTDGEIERVVNHVKAQQKVEYINLEETVAAYQKAIEQEDEPLLAQINSYLETIDEVSISSLQRHFKIGFNRSARIIELLEAQGRIMPSSGGKTRKVIH